MANYRQSGRETGQLQFVIVDMRKQLLPGTFEWALEELVDKSLDFGNFDAAYRNDEEGRPAINPRSLMKLVLYGYSKGILSSRRLEKLSRENVVAMALSGDGVDHSTIARFISGNSGRIKEVFSEVLLYCNELGLIGGDMFAIDGCRLPSNAAKEWSGTREKLAAKKKKFEEHAAKLLAVHRETDRKEYGGGKADSERTAKAIEKFNKKAAYIGRFLESTEDEPGRVGVSGKEVQSNVTDNESAKIKGPHGIIQGYTGIAAADSKAGVIVAAEAFGTDYEGGAFPEMLDKLQSALSEVNDDTTTDKKALLLADTNYFSEDNLQAAKERGIDVLIPDPHFRERDERFDDRPEHAGKAAKKKFTVDDFTYDEASNCYTCPAGKKLLYKGKTGLRHHRTARRYTTKTNECAGCPLMDKCMTSRGGKTPHRTLYLTEENEEWLSEQMRRRIDTPEGKDLYSRRMGIIEPCFANMEYCKGMNRFTLRTKAKVNAQRLLYCLARNIGKCVPRMAGLCAE
jgi:transposase